MDKSVTFTDSSGGDIPTAVVETRALLVSNNDELYQLLQASGSTGVQAGVGSVDLSCQMSKHIRISSTTLHAVILTKHTSSEPMRRPGAVLHDTAKRKLQKEGPVAFHSTYGDRYIAGNSCIGRFAGVFTMTFSTEQERNTAQGKVQGAVKGLSAGVAFSKQVQSISSTYTSTSWAAASGWTYTELPLNLSLDELYQAAKRMDPKEGAAFGALLCPYSELPDYNEAKDTYANSLSYYQTLVGSLCGTQKPWLGPDYYDDSLNKARELLGMKSGRLQYLMEAVAAGKKMPKAPLQELTTLSDKMLSIQLRLSSTFKQDGNLRALATRLEHYERDTAGRKASLWDQGDKLKLQLLQADQLEQAYDRLLQKGEYESEWFGSWDLSGVRQCIPLSEDGLELVCVAPCAAGCGRSGVSHLAEAAGMPIWALDGASIVAARIALPLYFVTGLPMLATQGGRNAVHAIYSGIKSTPVPGLGDVKRVDVLHGVVYLVGVPYKMVLKVRFVRRDGPDIWVPSEAAETFETYKQEWVSFPKAGDEDRGKVVAVSGQGHALKFHWKPQQQQ